MSSDNLNADVSQWFLSKSRGFSFDSLSREDHSFITNLKQNAIDTYQAFLERRESSNMIIFDQSCKDFASIFKSVSLEDNICKFAELDCHLLGLISTLEVCKQNVTKKEAQQSTLNNFAKQIDCLKSIKRFYENHPTYESYIQVVQDAVPGVSGQFSQGLPIDSVHKNLNSCIASNKIMNTGNYISLDYADLLDMRNIAYQRAKAVHTQLQLNYMDRYVNDFPLDTQTEHYLAKRASLVKGVESLLNSTAKQLSEPEKSNETDKQKAKSSSDLER